MKVSLKSALGLAVAHLALLIALAVGLERTLRSLENQLSADTVRLIAREQANLVHERSVATLLYPDADSRRRLHERIEDLTVLSEVVTSLAVVDADGHVVASQDKQSHGQFAPAAQLFGSPPQSRLEQSGRRSFLSGGDYVVLVPLVEEGRIAGYLRVGLHSDRIASLYQEGRSRLLLLGLLGLAAAAAVAVFLQVELSRRAATIAAALEGQAPPQVSLAPADEFARVLRSASRVKSDLEEARRESERRGVQVGALAGILQVGVVVAGRELEVDYVSARARELVGSADETAFRAAWERLRPGLQRLAVRERLEPPRVPRAHTRGRARAQRARRASQARGTDRGLPRPAARPARSRGARGGRAPAAPARRPRPRLSHPGARAARAARSHDDQPRPAARHARKVDGESAHAGAATRRGAAPGAPPHQPVAAGDPHPDGAGKPAGAVRPQEDRWPTWSTCSCRRPGANPSRSR